MFKNWFLVLVLLLPCGLKADWRDPTMPGNLPAVSAELKPYGQTTWTLSAILVTENGRYATINGKTVKAGGLLDADTRILKIMPNYVVIRQHETTQKLHLVPSVKKPLK